MATVIRVKYPGKHEMESDNKGDNADAGSRDKELLININCPLGLIIDYIKEVTKVTDQFDLCEELNYQVKNISQLQPQISGLDVFPPNTTYFIVTHKRDSNGQVNDFMSLTSAQTAKRYSEMQSKVRRNLKRNSSSKLRIKRKSISVDRIV